jgi:hypothetical protein
VLAQQPKHLAEPPSFQSASRGRGQNETALTGGNLQKLSGFVGRMAKPTGEITLAAQPVKVGAQWHVVGTYPSGQQERITGFKTEADALKTKLSV